MNIYIHMLEVINLIQAKGTRLSKKKQKEILDAVSTAVSLAYTLGYNEGYKVTQYLNTPYIFPPKDNKYHFEPSPPPVQPINDDKYHVPEFPHWDANKIWCDFHPNLSKTK